MMRRCMDRGARQAPTTSEAVCRTGDIDLLRLIDRVMACRFNAYGGYDQVLTGLATIGDDLADEIGDGWEDGRHILGWDTAGGARHVVPASITVHCPATKAGRS